MRVIFVSPQKLTLGKIVRTKEVAKSAVLLSDVLLDPDWGHSRSPHYTPLNRAYGISETLYQWYEGARPYNTTSVACLIIVSTSAEYRQRCEERYPVRCGDGGPVGEMQSNPAQQW